ncbi:unnamed protein product [Dibothriocephalus latus]|uniref:Uncharacterized protein n=1 Tax=Dibothriocephalus latus TaxID=60516 RepID=A0A3P7LKU7_DIBLA|nr:unnamed protein product [Dibothriocephalus latus]
MRSESTYSSKTASLERQQSELSPGSISSSQISFDGGDDEGTSKSMDAEAVREETEKLAKAQLEKARVRFLALDFILLMMEKPKQLTECKQRQPFSF